MQKNNINFLTGCLPAILLIMLSAMVAPLHAQSKDVDTAVAGKRFSLHFQATYIYQYQPEFAAKYSGTNSLQPAEDKENSLTATLYLGARLWKGAEVYINPEIAGGSGLSGAFGMAASTNGETFRVGDPAPSLYLARGMFTQTFQVGKKGYSNVDEGANEVGGSKPDNYIKFLIGKMSLGDIFDNNAYAKDPRSQFMNWCLMSNGAYDYAANVRGYTNAFATVLQQGNMAYKAAVAMLPVVANGADLNTDLGKEYSINAEIDRTYTFSGRKGDIRVLGYYNNGNMGSYSTSMHNLDSTGIPDVTATRKYGNTKSGFAINMDQQIAAYTGVFARIGWNDGKSETWVFTEADRSISAGIAINGGLWKRKADNLAFALVANGLSADHKDYLAAGGKGFQLGDGKLNYGMETVAELYYNFKPTSYGLWFSADYQFALNPGYNSDRGPVNVLSFRLHAEL